RSGPPPRCPGGSVPRTAAAPATSASRERPDQPWVDGESGDSWGSWDCPGAGPGVAGVVGDGSDAEASAEVAAPADAGAPAWAGAGSGSPGSGSSAGPGA